jgi:hypothetical protein
MLSLSFDAYILIYFLFEFEYLFGILIKLQLIFYFFFTIYISPFMYFLLLSFTEYFPIDK